MLVFNMKYKNERYFHGNYRDNKDTKGWFIGSFFKKKDERKTDKLEIMYLVHKKGDIIETHYHKEKIEILIMLEGEAIYHINENEVILKSGEFIFVNTNNLISGEFVESSRIFAIHSPSIPSDKFKP